MKKLFIKGWNIAGIWLVLISLAVAGDNICPVAASQSVNAAKNDSLKIRLMAADGDGDVLTYELVSGASHGSVTGNPPVVVYTPAADYTGADEFTFRVSDGKETSNTASVTVTVN